MVRYLSFFFLLIFIGGIIPSVPADNTSSSDDQNTTGIISLSDDTLPADSVQKGSESVSSPSLEQSESPAEHGTSLPYVPDRVIVQYRTGLSSTGDFSIMAADVNAEVGAEVIAGEDELGIQGLQVVELQDNLSVSEAIALYESNPSIEYAEPDYLLYISDPVQNEDNTTQEEPSGFEISEESDDTRITSLTPNDPYFSSLYGMQKLHAPDAWEYSTGSSDVIVAVVDTGVDYTHPDLAANMWVNSNEIPANGVDDDVNGYIDDYRGWDFYNNDNNPADDHSHGTHCAGTVGAVGNNGIGVVGVTWNVSIMPLKFMGAGGSGPTSAAISAINYARMEGADVISNSWGGDDYSSALKTAIDNSGAVVVCAAGNDYGRNTDVNPQYPSAYTSSNIIAVLSTDSSDSLSTFSNIGPTSVDLGAPGTSIYSTIPGTGYGSKSGTSMATPHVAGLAALVKAENSSLSVTEVKALIMDNVDPLPALSGKCLKGGRINAYKTMAAVPRLTARFYGVPGVEVFPLTVHFFDASTGNPTRWNWSFGDETGNSTEQNPIHVYNEPGSYTVILTAEG